MTILRSPFLKIRHHGVNQLAITLRLEYESAEMTQVYMHTAICASRKRRSHTLRFHASINPDDTFLAFLDAF